MLTLMKRGMNSRDLQGAEHRRPRRRDAKHRRGLTERLQDVVIRIVTPRHASRAVSMSQVIRTAAPYLRMSSAVT